MVWVAVVRLRHADSRSRCVTVLAFSPAAPLAMYATQVYPELPAALAVTVAIAALTGPLAPARARRRSASCIVALPWLSVKYAPVAAVLAVLARRGCTGARGDRRAVAVARRRLAVAGRAVRRLPPGLVRRLDRRTRAATTSSAAS